MSTVVAWAAKDTNGITSMYFISESRISWGKNEIWDHGQKVFSLNRCGIIAYCGDVLYPTQTISQIKDLIDKEILFKISEKFRQLQTGKFEPGRPDFFLHFKRHS